jgi:hypothetical protein
MDEDLAEVERACRAVYESFTPTTPTDIVRQRILRLLHERYVDGALKHFRVTTNHLNEHLDIEVVSHTRFVRTFTLGGPSAVAQLALALGHA